MSSDETIGAPLDKWGWPVWVPEQIRRQVEHFWSGSRGSQDWIVNAKANNAPEFWSVISLRRLSDDQPCDPGRFVFCWNNIGRIVHEDGTFDYVYF